VLMFETIRTKAICNVRPLLLFGFSAQHDMIEVGFVVSKLNVKRCLESASMKRVCILEGVLMLCEFVYLTTQITTTTATINRTAKN
jgi:hypothetical protein